jgi:hypothetical protein
MRIRTLLALGVGAAVGAGVTWLGDPEHGPARRVEARRWAMAQGRQQGAAALRSGVRAARTWAVAAADGFRESVIEHAEPA